MGRGTQLAKKQGIRVETMVAAAARDHVDSTDALLADIAAGIAEADAGLGSSIAEVREREQSSLNAGSTDTTLRAATRRDHSVPMDG